MKSEVYGKYVLVNIVETPYEIDNNKGIAVKLGFVQGSETFELKCIKECADSIVKNRELYNSYLYQPVNVALNLTLYAEKLADRAKVTAIVPVKAAK